MNLIVFLPYALIISKKIHLPLSKLIKVKVTIKIRYVENCNRFNFTYSHALCYST
jgi:hypothetical protein